MGMWPSGERSRMARRRLPSPMYPPSGKRRSQSPESSGPRCVCTLVIRASASRLPQFASPLMPHTASVPPRLKSVLQSAFQLVDFRLDVEELNALHRAIDQAGDTIQKSKAPHILVEEESQR